MGGPWRQRPLFIKRTPVFVKNVAVSEVSTWLRCSLRAFRINHGCTCSGLHHALRNQVETSETATFFTKTGVLLMNRGRCLHGPVESRRRLLREIKRKIKKGFFNHSVNMHRNSNDFSIQRITVLGFSSDYRYVEEFSGQSVEFRQNLVKFQHKSAQNLQNLKILFEKL